MNNKRTLIDEELAYIDSVKKQSFERKSKTRDLEQLLLKELEEIENKRKQKTSATTSNYKYISPIEIRTSSQVSLQQIQPYQLHESYNEPNFVKLVPSTRFLDIDEQEKMLEAEIVELDQRVEKQKEKMQKNAFRTRPVVPNVPVPRLSDIIDQTTETLQKHAGFSGANSFTSPTPSTNNTENTTNINSNPPKAIVPPKPASASRKISPARLRELSQPISKRQFNTLQQASNHKLGQSSNAASTTQPEVKQVTLQLKHLLVEKEELERVKKDIERVEGDVKLCRELKQQQQQQHFPTQTNEFFLDKFAKMESRIGNL